MFIFKKYKHTYRAPTIAHVHGNNVRNKDLHTILNKCSIFNYSELTELHLIDKYKSSQGSKKMQGA